MSYTIDEFNDITDWWELRDFCEDYGAFPDDIDLNYICDAETISEYIMEMARGYKWRDITSHLEELNWNGDNGEVFYAWDNPVELTGDDLETAKEQILSNLHSGGEYLDGEENPDAIDEDDGEDAMAEIFSPPQFVGPVHTATLYGSIRADSEYESRPFTFEISEEDLSSLLNAL